MRFGYSIGTVVMVVAFLGCKSNAALQEIPSERRDPTQQAPLEKKIDQDSTLNVQNPDSIEHLDTNAEQELSLMRTLPSSIHQQIQGRWELVSYQFKDGEDYMEIPIRPTPLDLIEHWQFKKSSYRRIMDEKLSFSASYTLLESEKLIPTFEGTHFIIHAKKVRSSIPGVKRPEDFFYGILSDESLILFYLGVTLKKDAPMSQGHMYEKK